MLSLLTEGHQTVNDAVAFSPARLETCDTVLLATRDEACDRPAAKRVGLLGPNYGPIAAVNKTQVTMHSRLFLIEKVIDLTSQYLTVVPSR